MHRQCRRTAHETGRDVGSAADGCQPDARLDRIVDPLVGIGWQGRTRRENSAQLGQTAVLGWSDAILFAREQISRAATEHRHLFLIHKAPEGIAGGPGRVPIVKYD